MVVRGAVLGGGAGCAVLWGRRWGAVLGVVRGAVVGKSRRGRGRRCEGAVLGEESVRRGGARAGFLLFAGYRWF